VDELWLPAAMANNRAAFISGELYNKDSYSIDTLIAIARLLAIL